MSSDGGNSGDGCTTRLSPLYVIVFQVADFYCQRGAAGIECEHLEYSLSHKLIPLVNSPNRIHDEVSVNTAKCRGKHLWFKFIYGNPAALLH